ncbi:glycoside hydrolase family 31 protein [Polychaeton citri CBS 116435]|uniref:Glycoside hydrolase family 31 protein n=1 Tax=Polychaeton citri CBS 116435 TaxID=1314669 RepID=A0A9P4UUC7_9PEZI|nr:glycoside hydrolase family 31 protein [Polychaeton citri CBS 116435]
MLRTFLTHATVASAAALSIRQLNGTDSPSANECPGYSASNVATTSSGLTADLTLAGPACDSFGKDIKDLKLIVNADTAQRLHVKIEDADKIAYQVPESVFPIPDSSASVSADESDFEFAYDESPFSFTIKRKSNGEVLFDSSAATLIFQDQYLRLRTALPGNPNLYGLGEHTDSMRLPTDDYTRTLWSRDAYGIPSGTNLYGNHPIYFDHRTDSGTHAVFLKSSAGMDIKINTTESGEQYLEYNLMSGVLDLYFLAGPSPVDVAKQYSEVAGTPAMQPYWGLGFHQCRYGYRDYYAIAEVIANYSIANIPLETMWTDIDYMYNRYIMTTDPDRFPIERVREYVDVLHERNQHYVVMVDPAVAYKTEKYDNLPYQTFLTARDNGYFVYKNGTIFKGVVWPGVTAFPDWFHPEVQQWWIDEFAAFFNADSGVDIDALWIDMNEAANFNYFGDNPEETEEERGFPPARPALRDQPRPIPGFPETFQPGSSPYPPDDLAYAPPWLAGASNPNDKKKREIGSTPVKRQSDDGSENAPTAEPIGYPRSSYELLAPPYQIDNANTQDPYGGPSNFTLDTDIIHYDGHVELDVHNIYGTMMSSYSRAALEARRPGRRPMVITRSTFAGAGKAVGKWLGDNLSTWEQYRVSIQGMLDFSAIYQMPIVGSDICGFGGNTTEELCARWATLGSFYPFMRNHNGDTSLPQEFFLWDTVAEAARNTLDIRYRLLDYFYTALHKQNVDGTPSLNPFYFVYPEDGNVFGIQWQFFFGDAIMVSPVPYENATSVNAYIPNDRFYNFDTWEIVEGQGAELEITDVSLTEIPLHLKGGTVLPLRNASAYTTTDVRKQPFNIVVAPNREGKAKGALYLDDGDSIEQPKTSEIDFEYEDGVLTISGSFGYQAENNRIAIVTILDSDKPKDKPSYRGGRWKGRAWGRGGRKSWKQCSDSEYSYDADKRVTTVKVSQKLDRDFTVRI